MNQPNQQVTQNYPGMGYPQGWSGCYPQQPQFQAQPVPVQQAAQPQSYQQYPVYQPYPAYPAPQVTAPGFALRRKDPRKSGALRTLNKMGLLMVAQTGLSFLLQLAIIIVCMGVGIDIYYDSLALVMISVGLSPICTAVPPLLYMLVGNKDWNFHLRFGRASPVGCLLIILAGLGVCMMANFPAAMVRELLEELGATEPESALGQGGGWVNFTVELLGVAVMVPMLEEFAFRGVILSGLRRYGTAFAVAASSLIFGMAHMSASSVVFATIAGLAMGTAYVMTGNLWVTVCIHALNNGIAVIESYSDLLLGAGRQELLAGITMLVVCAVGIIALVLLMVLRGRLFPKKEPMVPADGELYAPLDVGEAAVTMLKSPVLWAILAMVLVETAMMML